MTMTTPAHDPCPACTPSDQLRWISDFLELADRAITILVCVDGFDYPSGLQRGAQQALRTWARLLDDGPDLSNAFEVTAVIDGHSALAPALGMRRPLEPGAHARCSGHEDPRGSFTKERSVPRASRHATP